MLEKKSPLPQIGLAASTEVETLTNDTIQSLLELKLNHYRVEAEPSLPDWLEKFKIDCSNAKALKLPLEIAVHIADVKEIKLFYSSVLELNPVVVQIILLSVVAPPQTNGSSMKLRRSGNIFLVLRSARALTITIAN